MYIYEKVRARNFARAWGFAQASMAIPNAIGIPALGKNDFLFTMDHWEISSRTLWPSAFVNNKEKLTFVSRRGLSWIILKRKEYMYTEMVSLIISLEAMRMGFFLEFSSNVLLLLDPTIKMGKVFSSWI